MEIQFEKACEDGTIPGVVLMAQSKAGRSRNSLSGLRIILTNATQVTSNMLRHLGLGLLGAGARNIL